MSDAKSATPFEETPQRKRARLTLAIMNSAMAAIVCGLTIGPGVAAAAALLMAVLPYAPVLWRVIPAWAQANVIAAATALFLLSAIIGTIIWGIAVPFYIALGLVPVMLALIPAVALNNPPLSDSD
ncbi:conserved membrane protein of unknown function [Hyphomicrobium sp. 1Nfss2.1]|uniref:hypothetical protein n=1 Tax=Hyphomicrobium sp. 1Nfss2.1 TaxID=3413936 RepID=UPI003C799A00